MKITLVSLVAFSLCVQAAAPTKTVAITFDDLPYAPGGGDPADQRSALDASRKLLAAIAKRRVPVTAFVIQRRVEELGPAGPAILRDWLKAGCDLGNHTYSHPDVNQLSIEQIEDEIMRGETAIAPLMRGAGRKLEFLRFPYNHTGDTAAKRDAIAAFLHDRGYRPAAASTIDTSDYIFNQAYVRLRTAGRENEAARLQGEYLTYSAAEIDYYTSLNRQVLGYEPPEIMLLHANRLNSELIDKILDLFRRRGYSFVTLSAAESDPAYANDLYVTKFGPMWAYRWAAERHVKVNGALEPDPPQWISKLAQASQ